ncbi:hypothetical protein PPO43_04960 [Saprospira sp. CCB-QB6]|uniref:tetratricopeptide repeat protein n=1 Tax=Saprospira sp. CCB-QB6 TaxID=3023936 RepID=UPI00234A73F4|nr:hypothetical protein [Saprospira sp. CCB-QB6]WCL82448.1 hypothetical protein PPO43_04960 [Saprospira sp. CCB-QB6]
MDFYSPEWLDAFQQNQLSSEERAATLALAQKEPEYAAQLKAHGIAIQAIQAFGRQTAVEKMAQELAEEGLFERPIEQALQAKAAQKQIGQIAQELETEGFFAPEKKKEIKVRPLPRWRPIMGIAASLILLLSLGYWWQESQALPRWSQEYTLASATSTQKELQLLLSAQGFGQNEAALRNLQLGLNAYEKKDWEKAKTELQTYQKANSIFAQEETQFYLGHIAFELGQIDQAKTYWQELSQLPSLPPNISEQLSWYQALLALRENQKELAKNYLKKVPPGPYQEKAKQLLQSLE